MKLNFVLDSSKKYMSLPKEMKKSYRNYLQNTYMQMDIPVNEGFFSFLDNDAYKTEMFSTLLNFYNLPDDPKAQHAAEILSFLKSPEALPGLMLQVKQSNDRVTSLKAKAEQQNSASRLKEARFNDQVIREVSNYQPIKTFTQNAVLGENAIALVGKDPNRVLFRDYKEAVIELNRMLTLSGQITEGRDASLTYKSAATQMQQVIDRFKGKETDFINPAQAKITMERLKRVVEKTRSSRDTILRGQLGARVRRGVLDEKGAKDIFAELTQSADSSSQTQQAPQADLETVRQNILKNPELTKTFLGMGVDANAPDFAQKYAEAKAKRASPAAAPAAPSTPTPEPSALEVDPVVDQAQDVVDENPEVLQIEPVSEEE
ncbi:MAG TPA: hypothetical protein VMZ26_13365 [Pyrinomonadaceae bacterium]|nr:hypothetical protein [Pyrinomonadaceae bacterium]